MKTLVGRPPFFLMALGRAMASCSMSCPAGLSRLSARFMEGPISTSSTLGICMPNTLPQELLKNQALHICAQLHKDLKELREAQDNQIRTLAPCRHPQCIYIAVEATMPRWPRFLSASFKVQGLQGRCCITLVPDFLSLMAYVFRSSCRSTGATKMT